MGKIKDAFASLLGRMSGKPRPQKTVAIILAGGSSTRMGEGLSKQWLTLGCLPVIVHTLLAFDAAREIDELVLVIKKEQKENYRGLADTYGITKPLMLVTGGNSRAASAKNGFLACADRADFVAIHDGARCLITPDEIDRVCREAYSVGAATAAAPVVDTVKLANDSGYIDKTIDRNRVWLAQTPQVFAAGVYHAALAVAQRDAFSATDDCALAEHIGHHVKLVECSLDNLKLTTPADIPRAEAVLGRREKEVAQ